SIRCAMFSGVPVRKLSMQITWQPRSRSAVHRWLPRNPAPPVTSARRYVQLMTAGYPGSARTHLPSPTVPPGMGPLEAVDESMAGSITVVVVTRNRQDELARTLPRHEAPVMVVDSGSSDGTAAVARAAPAVIEVVELAANHGAYARTIGALCARTPYVAF